MIRDTGAVASAFDYRELTNGYVIVLHGRGSSAVEMRSTDGGWVEEAPLQSKVGALVNGSEVAE